MAKDYSGLNPRSAMGGGDLGLDGNGLSVGKLWSDFQVSQVEDTINTLRLSGEVSTGNINQSVSSLKEGIHHPTWQSAATECIEAIYDFSTTIEGKVNVISQLLEPDVNGRSYVSIIAQLIQQDDGKSPIHEQLGSESGLERLLGIATRSSPQSRSLGLVTWAKEAISPKLYEDSGEQESQVDYSGADGRFSIGNWKIALAAASRDADEMASLISESEMNPSELKQLSQILADQFGQDIQPVFQEMAINSEEAAVRQFAFDGLMRLTANQGEISQAMGPSSGANPSGDHKSQQNQNDEMFDLSTLKSILNQPGVMINSLAARVGVSPETNAKLLQIILGD